MMRKITTPLFILLPILAVLVAAGCGGSAKSGASSPAAASGASSPGGYGYPAPSSGQSAGAAAANGAAKVGAAKSTLGQIIVNGTTRTLYLFEKDRNGRSACYGPCATYWPPLLSKGNPVALPGANQGLIGTIRRVDGAEQVTYAGHPVYQYVGDSKPGQTTGEGLTDFGAAWDAISPAGMTIEHGAS
jgi:predicted lipoprotein with Yx(FWY)xxD motif